MTIESMANRDKSGAEVEGTIVDPEISMESRRCKSITNVFTGNTWERDLDPRSRWDQAYQNAVFQNDRTPGKFEFEMEDAPEYIIETEGNEGMEKRAIFTVAELQRMSKPRLDEIGRIYGVKSSKITSLILSITDAQTKLVEAARLESLPGRKKQKG
jgi:hypothetical protein